MTVDASYPPATRGTVIVWGLLAGYPFGGMTWQVLHYLVGLRRLGFDVWYLEDRDEPMLHPTTFERTSDVEENLAYLRRLLEPIGFGGRWAVRAPGPEGIVHGALDRTDVRRLYRDADAALNLCGAHHLTDDARACQRLTYVETDPVETQVDVARGDRARIAELDAYRHHFTYGTNLLGHDCRVPVVRYAWRPTRPPVVVDWWRTERRPTATAAVTTIANWNTAGKSVRWNGETWSWNKRSAFLRFIDAPAHFGRSVEIAAVRVGSDDAELRRHGWKVRSAWTLSDPHAYRDYVRDSWAEFSVAKEQYVAPRSGWFSDRSVCYLAAGRPVLVQDTGFFSQGPDGGLLTFRDEAELADRARELERDYGAHAAAATDWADRHFDAELVLGEMMDEVGL
jgi:hypothetical protein